MFARLREWTARAAALFRRDQVDRDFEQEIEHHSAMLEADYQREGFSPDEARRRASQRLGNRTALAELHRDWRGFPAFDEFVRDLRLAARGLRRSPGITVLAVLSLALGAGGNTAVFSLLDQLLFRPLPVERPEELVVLEPWGRTLGNQPGAILSYSTWRAIDERNPVFTHTFAHEIEAANAGLDQGSDRVWIELVSGRYFEGLGVKAHLGRLLGPGDDLEPFGSSVAVLSHAYWRTHFDSDPNVTGKTILLNGRRFTIAGVSAAGFSGVEAKIRPQIRIPLHAMKLYRPDWIGFTNSRFRWLRVHARLKPGVSRQQAISAIQTVYRGILEDEAGSAEYAGSGAGRLQEFLGGALLLRPGSRPYVQLDDFQERIPALLFAVVGVVLLIACANVSNLLLARAASRRREMAVRLAMGGSRARLVRQLLAESLLLAMLAGVTGLVVAKGTLIFAISFAPAELPVPVESALDGRVLLFSLAIALSAGLVSGLFPALTATRMTVAEALKEGGASLSAGAGRQRFGRALVAGQVALTLALLSTAVILVLSLRALQNRDFGFRTAQITGFSVDAKRNGHTPARLRALEEAIVAKLGALPGVTAVGFGKARVLGGDYWRNYFDVEAGEKTARAYAVVDAVSPGYFAALGVPVLRGREFTARDSGPRFRAAVVNEAFVKKHLERGDPVGQRMALLGTNGSRLEVIGVVKDWTYEWIRGPVQPQVFLSALEDPVPGGTSFYVRSAANPAAVSDGIRRVMRETDPSLPVFAVRTMESQIEERLIVERFLAQFSMGFGLVAAILALVGLYGVMAFRVAGRLQEIGVRMALGADRERIVKMVVGDALRVAGAGAVVGIALAFAVPPLLRQMLHGLPSHEPAIIVSVTLAILLAAVAAAWIPAWRAGRVDPVRTLRPDRF